MELLLELDELLKLLLELLLNEELELEELELLKLLLELELLKLLEEIELDKLLLELELDKLLEELELLKLLLDEELLTPPPLVAATQRGRLITYPPQTYRMDSSKVEQSQRRIKHDCKS